MRGFAWLEIMEEVSDCEYKVYDAFNMEVRTLSKSEIEDFKWLGCYVAELGTESEIYDEKV